MAYIVEIFFNGTDTIVLHDALFVSIVGDLVKVDRLFDEPIFDLNEIEYVTIKKQWSPSKDKPT